MQLKTATKSNNEIIIMGDLNINYLDKTNHADIKTLLTLWGLTQTITQPTRTNENSSTLIDVILTNRQNNLLSQTYVVPISFSDHDMICCVRKLNWQKFKSKQINCRDYKNYSKERFYEELNNKLAVGS